MKNLSTAASNVIPFQFEAREVRTLLIDDQPWFAAQDILHALGYADNYKPARATAHVPVQWKGVHRLHTLAAEGVSIVRTPGGEQKLLMLSEQGLYFFLGRSDKPQALPFQMWLAGEVLPAIRKHGRYVDGAGKMDTLLGSTIGTNGFNMLGSVIKGKVAMLPKEVRRRATMKIWSQTHTAFGVRSAQDIPADQLDAARNFVAAYALEGEWIGKASETGLVLTDDQAIKLSHLLHSVAWVGHRWHQGIGSGLQHLNRGLWSGTFEHVDNMIRWGAWLDHDLLSRLKEVESKQFPGGLGGIRPQECIERGIAA